MLRISNVKKEVTVANLPMSGAVWAGRNVSDQVTPT